MLVLGIESSCDETAAALVVDGTRILSSVVASQVLTHARYGGVVPELASREHLRKIVPVVEEACLRGGVSLQNVDAIAVTEGPGLIGSLLVGVVYGKAVARALGKPLVGVNHLEGHIHAVLLETAIESVEASKGSPVARALKPPPMFPNVTLVVSGGHTSLFRVATVEEPAGCPPFSYHRLGQTRDDAAGEAFDKVAKLLGLGYPGGPLIDSLARHGDPEAVEFGRIRMKGNALDFSFSGVKTAVLYRVRASPLAVEAAERGEWRTTRQSDGSGPVTADEIRLHCSQATLDLVASFQNAVVTDLVERTFAARRGRRRRQAGDPLDFCLRWRGLQFSAARTFRPGGSPQGLPGSLSFSGPFH